MIYKTINSIILAVFVGIYIITMFGTRMAFGTVNENINNVNDMTIYTQEIQRDTVDNLMELTNLVGDLSTELLTAQIEIETLKQKLNLPNRLDEQANFLFEALAEE